MGLLHKIRVIDLPMVEDPRGNLCFGEIGRELPFEVKRIFYIFDIPGNAERGDHAHKTNDELVIAVKGRIEFVLDDGKDSKKIVLDNPRKALLVPAGVWVKNVFSADAVCLALASTFYNEKDYIRTREEYMRYIESLEA